VLAAGPSDALFVNADCRDNSWREAALSDAQWRPRYAALFEPTRTSSYGS
jgi:hypothetical protein